MPRYDVVLLDADNTLFDFDAAEQTALGRVLEGRGIACTPEIQAAYREINRALWSAFDRGEVAQDFLVVERFRRLMELLGGGHDPADCNADFLTYLGENSALIPGAEELCRDLSAGGCRLALATNGVARVQHARLAASPLAPYLSGVFISEEVGAQKPQPAFFAAAFAAMGVAHRSRCVMVGDGLLSDVKGGIAAGIDTIWYNPKGLPGQSGICPTHTAASYREVRRYILDTQREENPRA